MRHRLFGLFVVIGAIAEPAYAENKCQLQNYAEMPVTMVGAKGLISGTINGKPARFFADSGAFYSILTREAADRLGLRMNPDKVVPVRGTSGIENMRLTTADEFTLAGFAGGRPYKKVEFLVGSNTFAGVADGLIGQNILGAADTEFDLANGFIRLFKPVDCGKRTLAYWAGNSSVAEVDISIAPGGHLLGDAKLNGKKIRVVFDTGASSSLLELRAAAHVGIKPESEGVVAGGVGRGIGTQVNENWIARFDSFDLGGELIQNARLRMGDVNLAHADMLLGADFFLSHRVYVAAKQKKIFFTYNGGQVFDLRPKNALRNVRTSTPSVSPYLPPSPASESTPNSESQPAPQEQAATNASSSAESGQNKSIDAAALRRRGAASMSRRDFQSAVVDFDEAIKLEPAQAEGFYLRAVARTSSGQPKLAMDDFNEAIRLRPDYVEALIRRGTLRIARGNSEGGHADINAAGRLAANDPTLQLQIAQILSGIGQHDEAIEKLDAWIAAYPKDSRLPSALMERCRARSMTGKQLDLALADCNAALRKGSEFSQAFDNRAFVLLQRGDIDKSISDYKASIKLQPKNAFSLYGLGVAELKKGLSAKGNDDIQAALAINSNIAEVYKRRGLTP